MEELFARYPALCVCKNEIEQALQYMERTYRCGGKILLCGNGGSHADCDHMVGELMKSFVLPRRMPQQDIEKLEQLYGSEAAQQFAACLQRTVPAISLPSQGAILSAYGNDVSPQMAYAQLVYGYGRPCDLLLGFSTSGNSENIVNAAKAAKAFGLSVLAFTGKNICALDTVCDVVIKAPAVETYQVQEYHLPIYHYLCMELEKRLFSV